MIFVRKYIRVYITILILFIIARLLFCYFYKGGEKRYTIQNDADLFTISENYVRNQPNELNHYYFEVHFSENTFNFFVEDIFKMRRYIIETVYSFHNSEYSCILPIFANDKVETDILCYQDSMLYHYRDLKGQSSALDSFADSMKMYGYQMDFSSTSTLSENGMQIQNRNLVSSHTLAVPSYKGLYIIKPGDSSVSTTIDLFHQDVYMQPIQGVASKYYVVADYDNSYTFHKFLLIDLSNGKKASMISDVPISFDSYVQGVVEDSMYVMDRSNRKQYKIDMAKKIVSISGNSNVGVQYYQNGKYEIRNIYDALNQDLYMYPYRLESDVYEFVDLYNGIYYSYLKVNDGYDVYISFLENPSLYSFGFHLTSLDRIQYVDDYVYYIEDDTLFYYHPKYGVIDIVTYSEFFYNSNLKFWIYAK